MTIGYIGLGKMGKNMVLRLLEQQHQVIAWNRSESAVNEVVAAGAIGASSIEDLVKQVRQLKQSDEPAVFWIMLPAGDVTETILMKQLFPYLQANDIVIDGANSNWNDTLRRNVVLSKKQIHFIDAGISGGPSGARNGTCVMLGGEKNIVEQLTPLWESISAINAYGYFGKSGAGHFVKMVHNGIEYGMMQAIGEGFEVMKKSGLDLNLTEITRVYNQGSVIESKLIGWLGTAYQKHGEELEDISGSVAHSGEGQWTVEAAKKLNVPVPIIEGSLQFRIDSEKNPSYTGKVVSALRGEFGGHEVKARP